MSDNSTNKNVKDDEIDLLDLLRSTVKTLGNWLNNLGLALLKTIIFLLRNWLPLGLSILVSIGISFLLKVTSESKFTSDMVLRSNAVSASDLISHINRLHKFCLENNSIALSDALSINSEPASNIIDISAFWIIDQNVDMTPDFVDYNNKHDVYDTTNARMNDRLDIRVKFKSPQELGIISSSIINFIDKDSLFQQRNRVRLRQNFELITRLDYDIVQLDSLQKVKYFEETRSRKPLNGGQMIFLQEQNTQLVYTDIYGLYDRKQRLETERDLYKGIVTVLSDFSIPAKKDNGALYYGKYLIPSLFFLTILILILNANKKKLKEIYEKY